MAALLSIKDLNIQFSNDGTSSVAVKQLSLDIAKGEVLAIVGESGSGKSVTALSLLQLLPGNSRISGKAIFHKDDEAPLDLLTISPKSINSIRGSAISMIFQEPMTALNPVFTCGAQVMEVIQLHQGVSKQKAREKTIALFEKVKLPDPAGMLNRYPHQLSGGQKQRVMIAMAMSGNPLLLIADEPTTALDVTVQKTILELIKTLQLEHQMSVLIISHDLGLVADIADRIVVMYQGTIVEEGPAAMVLQQPKHPYTRALLSCRPAGNSKEHRLPVVTDFVEGNAPIPAALNKLDTPKNPSTPLLEVKDLEVAFPIKKNIFGKPTLNFKAVDGVSFIVQKGETVGLVGESGCGKTSLGRAILQLLPISAGAILLEGKDISRLNPAALRALRKDLQIVFQDPFGSLNPRMNIGNAILEPLSVHDVHSPNQRRDKVIELLEKVNLKPDHFNRYPHQFSGGQRQRICIARALALNPSFLVFDESVSALDVSVQAQVLNLLNDLKKEFGFTSIFISHDLSVVHYISDRILVMLQGKIVEEGNAEQVYRQPVHEYTKQLIGAIPGKKLNQLS